MMKAVPRGFTGWSTSTFPKSTNPTVACADAYLTPKIRKYIAGFRAGFTDHLAGVDVQFMQSDGGLCPVEEFFGSRAILSGPAAGVVGVALTAYEHNDKQPVIGFDMGGGLL